MSFKPSKVIAGVMKWGSWGAQLSTTDMASLLKGCLDIGVHTFDHADIYGGHTTEAEFGKAFSSSGVKRSDVKLISKCGIMMPSEKRPQILAKAYDYTHEHIINSVDKSLQNLETDYLDLLLLHRPSPLLDPKIVAKTAADLQSSGKVLHFGVSNFTPSQVKLMQSELAVQANQIEISPYALGCMVDGTLDQCITEEIIPMAWSPLAGGQLFGLLSDPQELAKRERLLLVAKKYNWDLDYMIYLFLLHHPAQIHIVTGSSKIERIKIAQNATGASISNSQWFEIYEACRGHEIA